MWKLFVRSPFINIFRFSENSLAEADATDGGKKRNECIKPTNSRRKKWIKRKPRKDLHQNLIPNPHISIDCGLLFRHRTIWNSIIFHFMTLLTCLKKKKLHWSRFSFFEWLISKNKTAIKVIFIFYIQTHKRKMLVKDSPFFELVVKPDCSCSCSSIIVKQPGGNWNQFANLHSTFYISPMHVQVY